MIKLTVLYGHPTSPEAFEKYYAETHLEVTNKVSGTTKLELTKFLPNPDGTAVPYYRMTELYFTTPEAM